MGVRSEQKSATRARILAAARSVLGGSPDAQARLEDVAAEAGVAKATVLFHFSSRAALRAALADEIYESFLQGTGSGAAGPGVVPFLRSFLTLQHSDDARLLWRLADVLWIDSAVSTDARYRRFELSVLERALHEGIDPDRARRLVVLAAPAALTLGRRVALGTAGVSEVEEFLHAVDGVRCAARPPAMTATRTKVP